jgi:hypothetical protein
MTRPKTPGSVSIPVVFASQQPAGAAPVFGCGGGSSRLASVLAAVSKVSGVNADAILGKSRRRDVADARRLAIFAAHAAEPGLSSGKLAVFFRVSRTCIPVSLRKHRQLALNEASIERQTALVLEALQIKGTL